MEIRHKIIFTILNPIFEKYFFEKINLSLFQKYMYMVLKVRIIKYDSTVNAVWDIEL